VQEYYMNYKFERIELLSEAFDEVNDYFNNQKEPCANTVPDETIELSWD
jgi:hypothetical protein